MQMQLNSCVIPVSDVFFVHLCAFVNFPKAENEELWNMRFARSAFECI